MDEIFTRSALALLGLSLLTSPIGCFLVWRRLSFFGDVLAHASLLGAALSFMVPLHLSLAVFLVCGLTAFIIAVPSRGQNLPQDAWLAMVSYGALAIGLVCMNLQHNLRIDPSSLLFGDILAVDEQDIFHIFLVSGLLICLLALLWRPFLLFSLDEDLAFTAGAPVQKLRLLLMLSLSITIAVGLKVAGALLIPALLIIPALTASRFSSSPEGMLLRTFGITLLSSFIGLGMSFSLNLPTGPTIVIASLLIFLSREGGKVIYASRKNGGSDGT